MADVDLPEAGGEPPQATPDHRRHKEVLDQLEIGKELDWEPMRIVPPDPWTGHIPLAFWLVKILRPRAFVELGTHSGNSYFAFCQAMAAFSPAARAYAVDTWLGDEHAGDYDENVFADVHAFNTQHFRQFSTLLRATFDDARAYFTDGEVDLLHIDGMHTYEAVRHDFETWERTLSRRGVVLFHDTNVRERNFGVWRFWRELTERFPFFEFDHSNGLGIIGVGPEQPAPLLALFALSGDAEAAGMVRRRIAARGAAFQRLVAIQNLETQLQSAKAYAENLLGQLKTQADLTAAQRTEFEQRLEQRRAEEEQRLEALRHGSQQTIDTQRDALAWHEALRHAQREVIAAREAMIRNLEHIAQARLAALAVRDELAKARDAMAEQLILDVRKQTFLVSEERRVRAEIQAGYEAAIQTINADRAALERTAAGLRQDIEATKWQGEAQAHAAATQVAEYFGRSLSWKVTRPLRAVSRMVWGRRVLPPLPAPPPLPPAPALAPPEPPPEPPAPDGAASLDAKSALRGLLATRLAVFLASAGNLVLPSAAAPEVSIILVLYNQAELTFGCLGAIIETLAQAPFGIEVIIADNASTDSTHALLGRIEGATILRQESNLHFLKAVNLAAKSVRGKNILLLNNDAQLLPGSLASALRTLQSSPKIGAVGGRIILPDGTLQEAGSIIWRDGACTGYGRGEDPNGADFMFQRDVDYCSGAFLLTPAKLFEEMGGFDERFAPAYYEETDYCVRLWEHGYRVVYDPDATILHVEFGSSAASGDAIRLQQANHGTFTAQHRKWLSGQYSASPLHLLAARTHSQAPRILVLEDRVPHAALGSGYPRANRMIHDLLETGAQIAFYPMTHFGETWHDVRRSLDKRIEVLIKADANQLQSYLHARKEHFDGIVICRPHNMRFFLEAVGPEREILGKAKIYYDAEALFVTRDLQFRAAEGHPASQDERHRLIAEEVALTRMADVVLSVSPPEQAIFQDYGAPEVRLLGFAMTDTPIPTTYEARGQIVFLGPAAQDNTPNTDAILWFAREILPLLRRALDQPELRLTMIGLNNVKAISALEGSLIDAAGMVDELAPALSQARIMVVPSRFGAGIPLKVQQAAMLGIPMVVTSLIANQLGWQHERELLVADEPGDFAAACARLYGDKPLWERVRAAALARAKLDCAPENFAARLKEIVRDTPVTHRQPEPGEWRDAPLAPPAPPPEPHTSRPAADDWAMAVPFGYPASAGTPRLGVICHLYYPEIAPELAYYLRHLNLPAELMVSTDTAAKKTDIEAALAEWNPTVRVMPNRGRDIAPKLIGFADAHSRFDLVLHLHSKVSDHAHFLGPWRSYLFETLLGSPETVRSILDAFNRRPDLGMVAPQHFESIRPWLGWNGNFAAAKTLAGRMGIKLDASRALDFPSGSMFWARPAALQPLLDLQLSFEDFPEEGRQLDHTPAHVIERLYFYACERSGHIWLKAADPAICLNTATIMEIPTPVALSEFVARHGVLLSGAQPIAKRDAPAPMMTRLAPGLVNRLAARKI